jgi:hypothetical protein
VPLSVGGFLVWLLFPAIVAAGILFPAYAIWRYRTLSAHGEGERRTPSTATVVAKGAESSCRSQPRVTVWRVDPYTVCRSPLSPRVTMFLA